jgi:hypothetical protein
MKPEDVMDWAVEFIGCKDPELRNDGVIESAFRHAQALQNAACESRCLRILDELSNRGWCVVLKKLPPKIGWIIEGSRSEYDAPCPDTRILPDTWACEAQYVAQTNRWMFSQDAFCKTPQEAVERVAELCAAEELRTGR